MVCVRSKVRSRISRFALVLEFRLGLGLGLGLRGGAWLPERR